MEFTQASVAMYGPPSRLNTMVPQRAANELEEMHYVERQRAIEEVDINTLDMAETYVRDIETSLDIKK
jgi:hypothetical protein